MEAESLPRADLLPAKLSNKLYLNITMEDTLSGCYNNMIAAIAPLVEAEEGEVVQQAGSLFKCGRLLKHHRLHFVSREMGEWMLNIRSMAVIKIYKMIK
jgi:hypothetical protein